MPNKEELLRFLNRKVFDPVLSAKPDAYSEADRGKLDDVQKKTRSEKERFAHYGSAQEIVENYKRDLHSAAAKRVNSELEKLKLPTLPSIKDKFLEAAGEK